MNIHMKRTTLIIDDYAFSTLKQLAARDRRTLSDTVNECLKAGIAQLRELKKTPSKVSLPTFSMGRPRVNLADRDALEQAMEDQ